LIHSVRKKMKTKVVKKAMVKRMMMTVDKDFMLVVVSEGCVLWLMTCINLFFSGQQVLGPRRDEDVVSSLFDAARRAGAEQLSPEEAAGSSSRGETRRLKSGGYVLGGHGMPSQPVTVNDDSDIEEIPQQPV
jgi:hypothetical protein